MSENMFAVMLPRKVRKRDRLSLLEKISDHTGLNIKEVLCKNQRFMVLDPGIDIDPDFMVSQVQSFVDWYENE